jgi:hypothetical protein
VFLHKQYCPHHSLKQVVSKTLLQTLLKKNPNFEALVNLKTTDYIRDGVDNEVSKLLATMKQNFKITK